jgi:hypothetical protein
MAQMPKFLEDYTTVDELISKMNKEYPQCRLVSEIVGYGEDWVIFKSSFYENKDDVEPKATAYAKQTSKDHNSWFEMANTKANGRCLRIVFSESTLMEEMINLAPSKSQSTKLVDSSGGKEKDLGTITYNPPTKKSLDEKVKDLEAEGLVEDISDKAQAIMDNIKEFAMEITKQDLDLARNYTAQALGSMGMSKTDVSINNLQSVKNKIQDIGTMARSEIDKGE